MSPGETPDPPAILQVRGLQKNFGRYTVLNGLDLSVRSGDVYGFLGRNGSGKTTTIRAVMGIIAFDGGRLELFGEAVSRTTAVQKQRIGYVSQEQHFYPWMTCRGLGRFVAGFYSGWDAAQFLKLLEMLDLPPGRRVSQLSSGMRAKLALAVALSHRPDLLILDEPTSGLDPAARREFLELVRTQARTDGRTTFFSSHIVEEVERIADRIGIMDQGRLAFEGDLETLRATVRCLAFPTAEGSEPSPIPPDFSVLSESIEDGERLLVLRAQPATWEQAVPLPGRRVDLSVEDIFLALTVGRLFER